MIRFCLILTGLTISAMSIGCCGPIGCGVDISMGHNNCGGVECMEPVYRPLDSVRQLRGRWACGSGCAETYYGEWRSTPPDAQDPLLRARMRRNSWVLLERLLATRFLASRTLWRALLR